MYYFGGIVAVDIYRIEKVNVFGRGIECFSVDTHYGRAGAVVCVQISGKISNSR